MTQTHPELRIAQAPAAHAHPAWAPARSHHGAKRAEPPAGLPPLGWPGHGAPAPQPRSGMRWGWIVLGVVAAIVAVAIIGTVAQRTARMTVNGSVTVYGMNTLMAPGTACQNPSMIGRPVSIFGSNGDLVGTSSLTGSGTAVDQWSSYSSGYADACDYTFTFANVTSADDFYTVTVGTDAAQGVGFSKDQLQRSGANITYGHS